MIITQEGSVSAAARKIHISQPTLSTQLRKLEKELGADLFLRRKGKLELSAFGNIVLGISNRIFRLQEEIRRIDLGESTLPIEIVIGCPASLPDYFLKDYVSALLSNKGIRLSIRQFPHEVLPLKLVRNEVDLVMTDQVNHRTDVKDVWRRLHPQRIVFASHPRLSHLKDDFPRSLHQVPFIHLTDGNAFQPSLDFFFRSEGLYPHVLGKMDDVNLMISSAIEQQCVIAVPENAIRKHLRDKALIKIGNLPKAKAYIWCHYLKERSKEIEVATAWSAILQADRRIHREESKI